MHIVILVAFSAHILLAAGDPELDGVVFQRKDGPFLLRFLRARKFDIERALALYVKYYHNRVVYSGVFEEFTPQSCANVLRSGVLRVLEHRMRDGAKVTPIYLIIAGVVPSHTPLCIKPLPSQNTDTCTRFYN